MLFSERQKIVIKYRNWLVEEMLKNSFHIKDDPETFLVFFGNERIFNERGTG